MLFFPLRSIAILLGVIIVSVAGCTDSVPSPSSEPASQSTTAIIKTIGTTISQPATSIKITVTESPGKIFDGEYRWAEYRINNTITLPPNPRYQWEKIDRLERTDTDYNGTTAIREKITVTHMAPTMIQTLLGAADILADSGVELEKAVAAGHDVSVFNRGQRDAARPRA